MKFNKIIKKQKLDDVLNVDFNAGDVLQIYCSATGAPLNDLRVNLIIAWRKHNEI